MSKIVNPEFLLAERLKEVDFDYGLEPRDYIDTRLGIYFIYKDHYFIYGIQNRNNLKNLDNISEDVTILEVTASDEERNVLDVYKNEIKIVEIIFTYPKAQTILVEILCIKNIDVDYCVNNYFDETFIMLNDLYLNNCIIDANNKNLYFSV
jgi:hypothetical protein